MHGMTNQPILRDGELRLRPARLPGDISLAVPWYNDPEVMRFSEGDATAAYDTEMVGRMYGYLADLGELYIIELAVADGWVAIGDVTLAPDTIPIVIGAAEHRSRGLGKRVLSLLINRARELGWSELRTKGIYTFNTRSRRLFASLGFVQDGDVFNDEGIDSVKFRLEL